MNDSASKRQNARVPATGASRSVIAPLPAEVIERIAAGEVIERPVSVVRELIDNALDAGATDIRVELREGGLRLIRVSDDGCGIPAAELPLACQPHTTSKIARLDDLARLSTLGFRGEALASVALVADLEILSATETHGLASGVQVIPTESDLKQWLASRERGTTVTVRHLFRSVPARQTLLGTPTVEKARCLLLIRSYACAHPATRFTVIADGELALQTPGTDAHAALVALFGADTAASMVPFSVSALPGGTISGLISSRAHTHPSRDVVMLTVNGRLVTNRALLRAAEAGYRPLLRKGRHPILLVSIAAPPEWIDATTHPAKAEVLLRREREIAHALERAVHEALGVAPASVETPSLQAARFHPQPRLRFPPPGRAPTRGPSRMKSLLRESYGAYGSALTGPLTALAQLNDTLILARGEDGALYLVDQHRAHERILFDGLQRQAVAMGGPVAPATSASCDGDTDSGSHAIPSDMSVVDGYMKDLSACVVSSGQLLLEPLLIELSPRQAAQLNARLHELASLGLALQPFGGQVFLVRSVPSVSGAAHSLASFVRDIAVEAAVDSDDWLDHLRASLACRAAIKRGQSLAPLEQQALLADLITTRAPAVCPHGSPIALALPAKYLADVFDW